MLEMFSGHCILGGITTGMLFSQIPARHLMVLSSMPSSSMEKKKEGGKSYPFVFVHYIPSHFDLFSVSLQAHPVL